MEDIRWLQRFSNYKKALSQLEKGVELDHYSNLERQGLIQAFEFTFELAWNTIRDFLFDKGFNSIIGSKDTIRTAFSEGIMADGEGWMKMIKSRNLSSHTYNLEIAVAIEEDIRLRYFELFTSLKNFLDIEAGKSQ